MTDAVMQDSAVRGLAIGRPWAKTKCSSMLIVLIFLYVIPFTFDLWPDLDNYVGGYGVLGIWGTIILTAMGLGLSMYYGTACVAPATVYRCSGPLPCPSDGLVFPEEVDGKPFPEELKEVYRKELKGKQNSWQVPWSDYNRTLHKLNNKYLYGSGSY